MSESGSGEPVDSNAANDKEFSCDDCSKTYATHGGLIYHVRNTDCGSITCPKCGVYFPTEDGMKTHYGTVHDGSLVTETTECVYCGCEFSHDPEYTAGKYCSAECCKQHRAKKRTVKTCPICEGEFEVFPAIEDTRRFCSEDCYSVYSSRVQQGKKNHNWKGGTEIYYGPNWNQQKAKARERDGHTCQRCGVQESKLPRALDVHHIRPLRVFKEEYDEPEWYELANDLDNLVSLCASCHHKWEGIPLRPDKR